MMLAALAAGLAVALLLPSGPARAGPRPAARPVRSAEADVLTRLRYLWAASAAAGLGLLAPAWTGSAWSGLPAAVVGGVGVLVVISRAEPAEVRRRREQAERELPQLVGLFAAALRSGAAPAEALGTVCGALPGPAADELAGSVRSLRLGADPATVWESLGEHPTLGVLGRTLARATRSGSSVADLAGRLADDLGDRARAETEDRARSVGVKAAVPLGLCLLPAFLLLGIVPLVAAAIGSLQW